MHGLRSSSVSLRRQQQLWRRLLSPLEQQQQQQQGLATAGGPSAAVYVRARGARGARAPGSKARPLPSPPRGAPSSPRGEPQSVAVAPTDPETLRLLAEAESAALDGRTRAAMVMLEEAIRERGLTPAQAYASVKRVLEAAAARPLAMAAASSAAGGNGQPHTAVSNNSTSTSTGIAEFFEGPGAWYNGPNFFRLAVIACNRAGRPRESARLLRWMRQKRLPVSGQAYSNVVHAASEAGEDALCLELLGEMRQRAEAQRRRERRAGKEEKVVMTTRDYQCGLRACGRLRDAATAQALMAEAGAWMERGELPLHGSIYVAGVEALMACGQPAAAVALLGPMERHVKGGARMVPYVQLRALVLACAESGDEAGARAALAYVKQPALLETLKPELQAVAPAVDWEEAMQRPPEAETEGPAEAALRAAGRADHHQPHPQQTEEPLMVRLGKGARQEDYRQALAALVDSRRPDLAQRLLRLMRARGRRIKTAGVNAVLRAHLKAGAFAAAWALLQEMAGPAGGGWSPEASTYYIMLFGCEKGARGREAISLVKAAQAAGVGLSEGAMAAAVCACAKARETINARRLIDQMENKGLVVPLRCWLELAASEALAGNGASVMYELASRGFAPTLRLHVICGLPERALQLLDALGPAAEQPVGDVAIAMAAAGQLKDPRRVVALLAAAEERPDLGAALAQDPLVVTNAVRALSGGGAGGKEEEEEEAERACTDAILRFIARHDLRRVDVPLVRAMRDQGRLTEAHALIATWTRERLRLRECVTPKTAEPSYSEAINTLGLLGAWPVAHYLYDEALLRGPSPLMPAFLRALVHTLTDGDLEEAEGEEGARLRRRMAVAAYRQAMAEGWVSHWGPASQKQQQQQGKRRREGVVAMDVHRFPFRLAATAVEAVLEDLLVQKPIPSDLWVVTGIGKHVHTRTGRAAGQRTLRDRLARYLAEAHGLLSAEDLAYLDSRQDGRIRITGAALRAWVEEEARRGSGGD